MWLIEIQAAWFYPWQVVVWKLNRSTDLAKRNRRLAARTDGHF
ncbi:hypothetical protein GCWU000324_00991 [Kingella oralis ATCC 51147]|uniref:Uncharacterized protein n=1 Tax=Kingella oralis ATCC 51147 TaxID=629741 RepID=C4GFS5_9NEIS|nr:hypothetical protein GCWU000324_00991 [Kingella oralis ATCC 51147]